jgi:phospholipase D1/2
MRPDLFEPGRNCWAVPDAAFAGAIVDAADYYAAFARAALEAERTIYLAGWQFDSTVELIRGAEARGFPAPRTFLAFLNFLCERRPALRIYILAWDFSPVFGADREWIQEWRFRWKGHPNIRFVFDDTHPVGACHHQKLAIIDGHWVFLGGMDICHGRWDVAGHPTRHPDRVNPDGSPYHPKHDVQVLLEGGPAETLSTWFVEQWRTATDHPIETSPPLPKSGHPFRVTIEFPPGPVALSMTCGRTLLPPRRAVKQIQSLLEDAVSRARQLIYVENQYVTAKAFEAAMVRRMRDRDKPPLEIVIMTPLDRAPMEFHGIAAAEQRVMRSLREAADRHGHKLGMFHPLTAPPGGPEAVWLHSKLIMIDDEILSVGSANMANRSMGFDTEINATWQAAGRSGVSAAIGGLRGRLIAEHLGLDFLKPPEELLHLTGIVERVGREAGPGGRVRAYAPAPLDVLTAHFRSDHTIIDPMSPPVEDRLEAFITEAPNSPVARLVEWMSGRQARRRREASEAGGGRPQS